MNGLLEILTNKYWMIEPNAAHAIRKAVEANLNSRTAVGFAKKKRAFAVGADVSPIQEYLIDEEGDTASSYCAGQYKTPFVNVLCIDGPITRNGGACSYGSIDHRDMLIEASNNPNCRGHIFVINTPGGSAWAKNDYQQGIEYARSKGLPVYAFIDGLCLSAGMYLAALCDKRFYMHPKNQVGSIGVMCAFYSKKDGEHNAYTNETFHEIYEPGAHDKNKQYRDIVYDGNDKELVDELVELGNEFRADVKTACPKATEEHLHGKVFAAADVKGVLVDEQSTFGDVVALCFSVYERNHPTSNKSPMEAKYLPLATACGVDELVMTEEGTHLDMTLVDKLTEKLNSDADAIAAAEQKINDLNATHEEAIAQMKAEQEKALADQKAEIDAVATNFKASADALAEITAEAEQLKADLAKSQDDLAKAQTELAGAKTALDQAQNIIADRDARIQELTTQPAASPEDSPANNGIGVEAQTYDSLPAYDSSLSPEENARIRNEWKMSHGI